MPRRCVPNTFGGIEAKRELLTKEPHLYFKHKNNMRFLIKITKILSYYNNLFLYF